MITTWYTTTELAFRLAILNVSDVASAMFLGVVQAELYINMNGVNGLSGWQWLFIASGAVTILLGFLGLAISLFPYIVPPHYTIWQAANAVSALQFALVGYSVVMPLTLAYTAYAYWVFRGKVAEDLESGGYGH